MGGGQDKGDGSLRELKASDRQSVRAGWHRQTDRRGPFVTSEAKAALAPGQTAALAAEVLSALDERRQIESISPRHKGFDLEQAYRVTAAVCEMRKARGEKPIGRKLGFTNSNIWAEYGVYAPIWGFVYDSTVREVDPAGHEFQLSSVIEPRIEPEITLAFGRAPHPDMTERDILECIEWVAHGFEVVQSLFPDWRFSAADTVAAFGLHGALLLGPRHDVKAHNRDAWFEMLSSFEVSLQRNGTPIDRGHARNVLGGPLSALRNAVRVLDQDKANPQIFAGELVTTGTITRAFPMLRGEVWSTAFEGAPFEGLRLRLI